MQQAARQLPNISLSLLSVPSHQGPCSLVRQAGRRRRRVGPTRASAAAGGAPAEDKVVDFYELLNVDDDATLEDIKAAYRYLAKQCHPDQRGDVGHDMCVLLNEAYSVLSSPQERQKYNACLQEQLQDAIDDFTGKPLSKWLVNQKMGRNEDINERRAVFVDEAACIGCKQCVWCASGVFRMEPEFGRSRAFAQWCDTEDRIQDAIDSCPVDCIHWVDRDELPALEYVMQRRVGRTNVGVMMAGQGGGTADVFSMATRFLKEREQRLKQRAQSRAYTPAQEAAWARAADSIKTQDRGWWGNLSSALHDMMDSAAGTGSAAGSGNVQVGQRRRQRRTQLQENAGTIPLERALVPIRTSD
ncbi:hypothetical protein CVIRNUC_006269 [Coccomyxa viridis]|uniref:Uncharacterized protein n=1 Tax=Coccomyxa viridis TaxID=1274662 RepID=A0AAV1I6T5_9CHLO|nr:hypothetical protein CVIRNUC_006269 [Coccomyxa viridis]